MVASHVPTSQLSAAYLPSQCSPSSPHTGPPSDYYYLLLQRLYVIASNQSDSRYRVLKIDRHYSQTDKLHELGITEDATIYSKQEVSELLHMIEDGNKTSGGLQKVVSLFYGRSAVPFLWCRQDDANRHAGRATDSMARLLQGSSGSFASRQGGTSSSSSRELLSGSSVVTTSTTARSLSWSRSATTPSQRRSARKTGELDVAGVPEIPK